MSKHSFDGLETQRLGRPAMKSIKLYKIATAPAILGLFLGGGVNSLKKMRIEVELNWDQYISIPSINQ